MSFLTKTWRNAAGRNVIQTLVKNNSAVVDKYVDLWSGLTSKRNISKCNCLGCQKKNSNDGCGKPPEPPCCCPPPPPPPPKPCPKPCPPCCPSPPPPPPPPPCGCPPPPPPPPPQPCCCPAPPPPKPKC